MKFECSFHKLAYEGRLTRNYNHKCFKCDGSGRNCLTGYNQFQKYCKEQEKEGYMHDAEIQIHS